MIRWYLGFLIIGCTLGLLAPAQAGIFPFASVEVLRPLLSQAFGNPPVMRLDVVPDIYEGGYALVSVYAQGATVKGMYIDETWVRLVGVSFDPALLREGTLKVLDLRDSAVYGSVKLKSVEAFLRDQGPVQDIHLARVEDAVLVTGTVLYKDVPTRVRMQGIFQVYGEPEIYFHIQALFVNSVPVPYVMVDQLERSMNPVVDFRTWPVPFKIRSFRSTREGFVISSRTDYSQPCNDCGGPELRLAP